MLNIVSDASPEGTHSKCTYVRKGLGPLESDAFSSAFPTLFPEISDAFPPKSMFKDLFGTHLQICR